MRILAVDDEKLALSALTEAIAEARPDAEISAFRSPDEALAFVKENPPCVAFLDIEMREIGGVELAKCLKLLVPNINIVFCTGYSQYQGDAFDIHASGYVLKPVTAAKIKKELENLRYPVTNDSAKRIKIQTFGNFEIFVDSKPVAFKHEKTRELVAYLVHRGTTCTNADIMDALWNDNHESYLRNLRKDLKDTLNEIGCIALIDFNWGKMSINKEVVSCDLYDWEKGIPTAVNAYRGEYMAQYSWAKFKPE